MTSKDKSDPTTTQRAVTRGGESPRALGHGSLHGSLAGASLPELAAEENADGEDEDHETHGHRGHRRPQLAAAGLVPGEALCGEQSRGMSRPTHAYITSHHITSQTQ